MDQNSQDAVQIPILYAIHVLERHADAIRPDDKFGTGGTLLGDAVALSWAGVSCLDN